MNHIDWAEWENTIEHYMFYYPSKKMLALPYKDLPMEAYYNEYRVSSLTPLLDAIFNTPITPLKPEDLKKFL